MSSVSAFIANNLNSMIITKSAICFFSYLKISIFHLASAVLLLLLNVILTSLTKPSQSQILFSSVIWLIFFCVQISAMSSLSQANTTVILSSIPITLLLLRNKYISLYQSSNFVQLPSNYPRSRTMFFNITACTVLLYTVGVGAVKISSNTSSVVLFLYMA